MNNLNINKQFFAAVQQDPMFVAMENTIEDSPYHREANVLVHTRMVVDEYVRLTNMSTDVWSRDDYLGFVACIFHDVGKPSSEIQKHSIERGNYRAYHGHELLSARMFENFASISGIFSAEEIYVISWMIEYHMPWNLDKKRHNMALTIKTLDISNVFLRVLRADQYGRITDNPTQTRARVEEWITSFEKVLDEVTVPSSKSDAPVLIVPIGASGTGKSTLYTHTKDLYKYLSRYSLDMLRHEFYNTQDYSVAYKQSVDDSSFQSKAQSRFITTLRDVATSELPSRGLYLDNTNLSAKRRGWYLELARNYGFETVAWIAPIALDKLLQRQKSRSDKTVPDHAVTQQYYSLQLPMFGEFDRIVIGGDNIE